MKATFIICITAGWWTQGIHFTGCPCCLNHLRNSRGSSHQLHCSNGGDLLTELLCDCHSHSHHTGSRPSDFHLHVRMGTMGTICVHQCMGTRPHGSIGTWGQGGMSAGCMGAWVQGAWGHVCIGTREMHGGMGWSRHTMHERMGPRDRALTQAPA